MAICNPTTTQQMDHVDNMNKLWRQWTGKRKIRERFTNNDGSFMADTAKDRLISFVEFKIEKPFKENFVLDKGEIRRLSIEINDYNRGLGGKWSNILGIVPEGISRQDPTTREFYTSLNKILDYNRLHINEMETGFSKVTESFMKAYEEAGMQGKYYMLGIKAVNELREIRKKAMEAKSPGVREMYEAAVQQFIDSDKGDFIRQYSELMTLDKREMRAALRDPSKKYNSNILQAVIHSRKLLNSMGGVYLRSLDQLKELITLKYSGNAFKTEALFKEIDLTKARLKKGIQEGGYFPAIPLDNLVDVKLRMEKIMSANGESAGREIEANMIDLTENVLRSTPETPDQLKAKNPLLKNAWDQDPLTVLSTYGRHAVGFNKLVHAQTTLVKAMAELPKTNNTRFIKGVREFIMEEYELFTNGLKGRADWVNNMTRINLGFQTARTMAFNVTGATKNAASAIHYFSYVGRKAVKQAQVAYDTNEAIGPLVLTAEKGHEVKGIRNIVDEVEKKQGFLFADVSAEILTEGLISKDNYNKGDIEFNVTTGEIYYKGTKLRDFLENSASWSIGKMLVFHRITENWQRRWMFRTAFVTKFQELMSHSAYIQDPALVPQAVRFSENVALNTVNAWAYEYAIHAKAKWVRGDGLVVDELGTNVITKKTVLGPMSEMALHLLHYPMSLLQTHTSKINAAFKAVKAKQYGKDVQTADEISYLMRYAGIYGLISLASVATNMDLHAVFENETVNRAKRTTDDIMHYNSEDKATFGLLSEVSGSTIGHLKYAGIVSGIIKLDRSDIEKLLFGNVDYASGDEDIQRYTAYQYSTEYGRAVNKTWPAVRDGRGMDLVRHWLNLYPRNWTKWGHEKVFGKKPNMNLTDRAKILRTLDLIQA
tara:strand:+ start:2862 stop:5510 length:2649 start_codon:yes stop_codon:yes gene_type:complete